MTDTLTITGNVATDPSVEHLSGGAAVTKFRLASTRRKFDQESQAWVDAGTNWYSVSAFRRLGEHAKTSLRRGDSVIVMGRLRIRSWESGDKRGTSVDIDADAIGHDLRWGTSSFLSSSKAHAHTDTGDTRALTQPTALSPRQESWPTAENDRPSAPPTMTPGEQVPF